MKKFAVTIVILGVLFGMLGCNTCGQSGKASKGASISKEEKSGAKNVTVGGSTRVRGEVGK